MTKTLGLMAALLIVSAFSKQQADAVTAGQPSDERKAQEALPKSQDPMWTILGHTKTHLDTKSGNYSATYPADVKALVGKQVTISGFILPLEPTAKFKHFILSKRTPTCPFCPPGEPNEIVEVWLEKPIAWSEDVVKVTGTFRLTTNAQLGMFFTLAKAKIDS